MMSSSSTDYYMLIASLPYIPRTFEVDQVPISRLRLAERLTLLDEDDQQVVEQVQQFLHWDRQDSERTDADVQREYERLMDTIQNSLVRDIIIHRMDVRTIMSGLRRRRWGLDPPAAIGQYVAHIRKHWQHPDFQLARKQPWIPSVRESLEKHEPLQVERELLRATWTRWTQLADQYYFSFETILLYLARWEIVDRWTRLDPIAGRRRFDTLLQETLGEHARIDN